MQLSHLQHWCMYYEQNKKLLAPPLTPAADPGNSLEASHLDDLSEAQESIQKGLEMLLAQVQGQGGKGRPRYDPGTPTHVAASNADLAGPSGIHSGEALAGGRRGQGRCRHPMLMRSFSSLQFNELGDMPPALHALFELQ